MQSKIQIPFLLIFVVILSGFHTSKEDNWKLVKNKEGIKAYTRVVEGSAVKQVKVETNFKAGLSASIFVFKDANTHKNWMYRNKIAKTIASISDTEYYYYSESEAPWPLSNRDAITHAKITQDKITKKVTITSTCKSDFIKEIDGIVRIKKVFSKWEFTPKKGGTVDLTFYMLVDLGGGIPAWLMNLVITDGPFETAQKFIKEVQKEKYRSIKLSYIEEL